MSVMVRLKAAWSWNHPVWGLALGLWLMLGDLRLTPDDPGGGMTFVSANAFWMLLVGCFVAAAIWLAGLRQADSKTTRNLVILSFVLATILAIVAGAVVGNIYNSYHTPAGRFMVLPIMGGGVGLLGVTLRAANKQPHADMLMLAGLTALVMTPFIQEAPLLIPTLLGLAATYLWLWPSVGHFARIGGLVLHFLAITAMLSQRPEWFTWTPFPLLTLVPAFIIAQYMRTGDRSKVITWWVGAAVASGTFALGVSTGISNLRKGLAVADSLMMVAIGLLLMALFWWFRFGFSRPTRSAVAA